MNSRELKTAYKLYDLLSIRGRLDILDRIEEVDVSICLDDESFDLFQTEPSVRVRHKTANGVQVSANITTAHLDPPTDELDSLENRLAYLTLDHLTGLYNG